MASNDEKGDPPSLKQALETMRVSPADQLAICQSKTYPDNVMKDGEAQNVAYTKEEIEAEWEGQADDLATDLEGAVAAEEEKKQQEEEKKAAAEEKKKQQQQDDKKRKEEDKKRKEEEDKRKREEKARKAVEDKKKAEEKAKEDEKKRKEKAIKDEEDEKKRKAKAIEDEKKRKEKAIKDAEDKKKREEKAKKDAEEKKKRDAKAAEEKKKRDEENKKKREEKAKKDAEEKKKRDKKAAEDKKKRDEENKKKQAEQEKKKAEDKKKKEEEKKKQAAEKKKKEEEKKKKEEEKKKKKEAEKKKRQANKKPADSSSSDDETWDEEKGKMVKKKKKINDRVQTEDTCCNQGGFKCCRVFSWLVYMLVFPAIYGTLVYLEYNANGWDRFANRSDKEYQLDLLGHEIKEENKPEEDDDFKHPGDFDDEDPEKTSKGELLGHFLKKNPMSWELPLLGLAFGLFANIVPFAPGLLLMPAFEQLDIAFTANGIIALSFWMQALGSGVFGFFAWCTRDARFFICRALFLFVPCIWLGYAVGVTDHLSLKDLLLDINEDIDDGEDIKEDINEANIDFLHTYVRIAFGCFMVFMSLWVLIGCCIGGMNHYCCPSRTGGSTPGCKSFCQWIICLGCCFNTGWLFLANIGAGAGVTSFFLLSLFLGVETKRAMPTAIVIGGWTAILPGVFHLIFNEQDIPYIRLLMMVPGLWFGTLLAPWFSRCGGPTCDLVLMFFLLLGAGTAIVAWGALHIQKDKDDLKIEIAPMYSIDLVDQYFEGGSAPPASSPVAAPVSAPMAIVKKVMPVPKPGPKAPAGKPKPGGKPGKAGPKDMLMDMMFHWE